MKILGPPIITTITTLIFIFFLYRYWNLLAHQSKRYRIMLFAFRSLALFTFLFLMLNPWINWTSNYLSAKKISVVFDISESVVEHLYRSKLDYVDIKSKIESWASINDLNVKFHRLGSKIRLLQNIDNSDLKTDFRDLPNFINYENPDHLILLSDGKATIGWEINDIKFDRNQPIHTVGLGPVKTSHDLAIEDVILPQYISVDDSVKINIRFQSRISENITSNIKIINETGMELFNATISFQQGIQKSELKVMLPTSILNGLNKAILLPMAGETQIKNNEFSFQVNMQEYSDDVLMITGALSPNTRIIKSILTGLQNVKLHHMFRLNQNLWNEPPLQAKYKELKMIVLDDFPVNQGDRELFEDIISLSRIKQVPILYLEGPSFNLTAGEIIRNSYPFIVPKSFKSSELTTVSLESDWLSSTDIDLQHIPPQNREIKWISNKTNWLSYSDGSVLIVNHNNFFLVTIPKMAGSHHKISNNNESAITKLLHKTFLHAFHGERGLLVMQINGNSFDRGEVINFTVNPVKELGLRNFSIIGVHAKGDTVTIECIEGGHYSVVQCTENMIPEGEYKFMAVALLPNGEKIYSEPKSTIVQDVNVELKELIQDRHALIEVSHKTGGTYVSIESLDTMLTSIDITPVQLIKNHQINGLSSQNYWWILVLLLSSEWYLRKKLGLL